MELTAVMPHRHPFKILVLDEDPRASNGLGALLAPGLYEVISCREIATAEAAAELTEFDIILLALGSSGIDGPEGIGALDFFAVRNPTAVLAVMVSDRDSNLREALNQRGDYPVLSAPPRSEELRALLDSSGAPLRAPRGGSEEEG